MKVYVSADIEGVTGIASRDEANPDHRDIGYFKDQMTREVQAACEGAIEAGATELLVKDAHWTGRNIDPRRLPECARIVRGWTGHPYSMMAELDSSFGAVMFVGYHARAGSAGNPLAHTMSSRMVRCLRINDCPVSEFVLNTYTATMLGVPVAMLAGDTALCSEVHAYNEAIATVSTMTGIGQATISIHPDLAVRRIKEAAKTALAGKDLRARMRPLPRRFQLAIDYRCDADAYGKSFYPGAALSGEGTVVLESDQWFDVLRAIHFCI